MQPERYHASLRKNDGEAWSPYTSARATALQRNRIARCVVDLRTVAGRLGHGGGGSTTLKVYAAWVAGADKKAAHLISSRLPRPPLPK